MSKDLFFIVVINNQEGSVTAAALSRIVSDNFGAFLLFLEPGVI